MIDFQIQRGPSSLIFSEPGIINPRLIIEEGCWYLCTDTAELFLGVRENDELTLKQINGNHDIVIDGPVDPTILAALRAEINEIKESLSNYATEQYVIDAITNHEGLAKVEEVKTKLETEVLPKVEKVEEIEPTVGELKTWIENKEYLQDIDLDGYATKEDTKNLAPVSYVDEKFNSIKIPEVDLEDYAKKEELFSKSYNDLTDKPEIPSVEGLATEDFVKAEIAKVTIPEVDTSKLVTTETFNNVLATKANNIPFTTDKFVTNPIGKFTAKENVKGMTVAEIFAKLLGLSDTKPEGDEDPEEPSSPETREEIINEILSTDAPSYVLDTTGKFVPTEYTERSLDASTIDINDGTSFFYTITKGDTVIEAGYQIATIPRNASLTVAIPDYIKAFHVEFYDSEKSVWAIPTWSLVESAEQPLSGYTSYEVPASYRVRAGSTIRVVIDD
jgi:hypothetical protein